MSHTSSSKRFLTAVLESLREINPAKPESTTNTQQQLPHTSVLKTLEGEQRRKAKTALLTLHFLFPHELLPALDLIDRKLITRLHTKDVSRVDEQTTNLTNDPTAENTQPVIEVYYVQSASSASDGGSTGLGLGTGRRGRFRNALSKLGMFYEIRLDGWNCTCPAFAYSGLKLMMQDVSVIHTNAMVLESNLKGEERSGNQWEWLFGGIATKDDAIVPVCKHTLAVALVRAAPNLFGNGLTDREVSREEIAGWAAGWGEH